jgi:hypothetical protein
MIHTVQVVITLDLDATDRSTAEEWAQGFGDYVADYIAFDYAPANDYSTAPSMVDAYVVGKELP